MTSARPLLVRFVLALAASAALATAGCAAVQRPDGGKGLLPAGAPAPDVAGVDQDGRTQRLADARGHVAVVYFYPKDATPGCTREACAFRDAWGRYEAAGVRVFGVSRDDVASHASFARGERLPFPLIADGARAWGNAFGVPSGLFGYSRVSFLVAPSGAIAKVYPDVDPGVHATEVLADANALAIRSPNADIKPDTKPETNPTNPEKKPTTPPETNPEKP